MFSMKSDIVILFMIFHVSVQNTRRIHNGKLLTTEKPYVVYLVRAQMSQAKYDYWLCGGALVTSVFVVTSAACIDDVNYLYVIAGYNKYVNDSYIDKDPCTREKKKKVIFTCCPAGYDVKYDQLERWSLIDIGVVKVESPYDFNDASFKTLCSYIPTTIPINYESKYQEPGTDALVYGWGHLFQWRKESDQLNYNQENLNYAPVMLMDKDHCRKYYEDYNNMTEVIDRYMICSMDKGNINDQGLQILRTTPSSDALRLLDCGDGEPCSEEDISYKDFSNGRRDNMKSNKTDNQSSAENTKLALLPDEQEINMKHFRNPRRYGICQNDHGGPLVTYVGTHEVLIGVASVFKVSEESSCMGPFLYTSTQCNGAFLNCVLTYKDWPQGKKGARRSTCKKKPNGEGHATVHRHISWTDHPAGPADNENQDKIRNNEAKQNPPPILRNPPVNEQYGVNDQHAIFGEYGDNKQYENNGQFAANQQYTTYVQYAVNGQYATDRQYAVNKQYATNDQYANNAQYAVNQQHTLDKINENRYQGYQANADDEINGQYFANERHVRETEKPLQTVKVDGLIRRPQLPLHS